MSLKEVEIPGLATEEEVDKRAAGKLLSAMTTFFAAYPFLREDRKLILLEERIREARETSPVPFQEVEALFEELVEHTRALKKEYTEKGTINGIEPDIYTRGEEVDLYFWDGEVKELREETRGNIEFSYYRDAIEAAADSIILGELRPHQIIADYVEDVGPQVLAILKSAERGVTTSPIISRIHECALLEYLIGSDEDLENQLGVEVEFLKRAIEIIQVARENIRTGFSGPVDPEVRAELAARITSWELATIKIADAPPPTHTSQESTDEPTSPPPAQDETSLRAEARSAQPQDPLDT